MVNSHSEIILNLKKLDQTYDQIPVLPHNYPDSFFWGRSPGLGSPDPVSSESQNTYCNSSTPRTLSASSYNPLNYPQADHWDSDNAIIATLSVDLPSSRVVGTQLCILEMYRTFLGAPGEARKWKKLTSTDIQLSQRVT